jgi:PKD repeat protein
MDKPKYMRLALQTIFLLLLLQFYHQLVQAQIFCKPDGNVIIYSNYDGGYLNINVDQNIPNLKIGITTYEDCEITISGTYAGNVTQVIYAGYQGDNQHCNPSPLTTSVNGVDPGIVTINLYPEAEWPNPNGYYYIICNYQCDSAGYQGGCNTPDQISYYYLTEFGGSLYYHYTQYGCWNGTYHVSSGGNCCIGEDLVAPAYSLDAGFTVSEDTVCIKEGIVFTNTSTSTYPGDLSYEWDFGDGTFDDSENGSHGYASVGEYTVTLTITDSSGSASDTYSAIVNVIDCFPTGTSEQKPDKDYMVFPNPANDELNVQVINGAEEMTTIEWYDLSGQLLFTRNLPGSNKIILQTSSIPPGLYCLKIVNAGGPIMKKVAIE